MEKVKDKSKVQKILQIVMVVLVSLGYGILTLGVGFFIVVNNAIIFSATALGIIFYICLLLFPIGLVLLKKLKNNRVVKIVNIALIIVAFSLLITIIVRGLVVDNFQPLSLSTLSTILLITGFVLTLLGAVIGLISSKGTLVLTASISLITLTVSGMIWASAQPYQTFSNISGSPNFIFSNKEKGYATFRIPSLYAVNHAVLNDKHGFTLTSDVLYAFSEGRINGSKDTGDIDIVYKYSTDKGETWSELTVLFSYGNEVGKYGNPTVVLDNQTGKLVMFYLKASEAEKYHYKTYCSILGFDSNMALTIESTTNISLPYVAGGSGAGDGVRKDTLMVGPGKGVQLTSGSKAGRLIMPCSNDGNAFIYYSDDNGATWVKGGVAGSGNECEAVEVNGELIMVIRENLNCSAFHSEQYQRLSYSNDGGETWYKQLKSTELKSPICMSSVASVNNKLCITYPNDFLTRANLTIGVSQDNGEHFKEYLLYNGASGYSCVTVDSDNNIYVLAEIGKVNYNENLVFLKINVEV